MENNKTYILNLEDYRTPGSKVFTGRDRGVEVRKKSKLDTLLKEYDLIRIIIPNDIRSINPSFLEELLFNVVSELKEEKFREKFHFESTGRYQINNDLDEAIERILRIENALA